MVWYGSSAKPFCIKLMAWEILSTKVVRKFCWGVHGREVEGGIGAGLVDYGVCDGK